MDIAVVPPYEELFDGERPTIKEVLADIPSKATIVTCSYINHMLLRNGIFVESNHREILSFLLNGIDEDLRRRFIQGYSAFYKRHNGKILVFSIWYSCELITWELANFREIKFEDTTPEHHLQVLKAYIVLSTELLERHTHIVKEVNQTDFPYQRAT